MYTIYIYTHTHTHIYIYIYIHATFVCNLHTFMVSHTYINLSKYIYIYIYIYALIDTNTICVHRYLLCSSDPSIRIRGAHVLDGIVFALLEKYQHPTEALKRTVATTKQAIQVL